jgi:hypothetical protein
MVLQLPSQQRKRYQISIALFEVMYFCRAMLVDDTRAIAVSWETRKQ